MSTIVCASTLIIWPLKVALAPASSSRFCWALILMFWSEVISMSFVALMWTVPSASIVMSVYSG